MLALKYLALVILTVSLGMGISDAFAESVEDYDDRYYKVENLRGEIVSVNYFSIHALMDRGYLKEMPECNKCKNYPEGTTGPPCYRGICEVTDKTIYRHGSFSIVDKKIIINDKHISNFNANISFDKKLYSTDDLLKITIMFPNHNQNDDIIEEINSEMNLVTIKTRSDEVTEFKFVETHPDSGIFKGEILSFDYRNPELAKYEVRKYEHFAPTTPKVIKAIPDGGVSITLIVSDIETGVGSARFSDENFYNYPSETTLQEEMTYSECMENVAKGCSTHKDSINGYAICMSQAAQSCR